MKGASGKHILSKFHVKTLKRGFKKHFQKNYAFFSLVSKNVTNFFNMLYRDHYVGLLVLLLLPHLNPRLIVKI